MNSERDADDLPVLARRGRLSDGERRRLRDVLAGSVETRFLYEAGCAFDKEAPVMAGDDERIERMVRQVQKGQQRSRFVPLRRRALAFAAAGMLIAGAAIGAIQLSKTLFGAAAPSARPAAPAPSVDSLRPARPALAAPAAPAADEPSVPAPEIERPASVEPAPAAPLPDARPAAHPSVRATPSAVAPAPSSPIAAPASEPSVATFAPVAPEPAPATTAAELFAAANRARVNGEVPKAITLTQRLQTEFPRSNEAVTSHLSLGVLYLQRGQAGLALEQFRVYRKFGAGATMAEALWGEAQALRQLGRTSEERAVLEELLQKYPRSAYSDAAQKRLAALH